MLKWTLGGWAPDGGGGEGMALVQVVEWDEPVTREVPVLAWKYTNPAQP